MSDALPIGRIRIARTCPYIAAASQIGPTPAGSSSGESSFVVPSIHRRRTSRPCSATMAA